MWAVMRVRKFSEMTAGTGQRLIMVDGGPQYFIPVFDSLSDAMDFCGGNDPDIKELQLVTRSVTPQEGSDHDEG